MFHALKVLEVSSAFFSSWFEVSEGECVVRPGCEMTIFGIKDLREMREAEMGKLGFVPRMPSFFEEWVVERENCDVNEWLRIGP